MKLEALADKITYKSDGHFLWAALVLEDLHRTSCTNNESVEDFVSKCPRTLYDVYCTCLAKVDSKDHKDVVRSLQIILAAKKPLATSEFKAAFAVNNGHRRLEYLQQDISQDIIQYL